MHANPTMTFTDFVDSYSDHITKLLQTSPSCSPFSMTKTFIVSSDINFARKSERIFRDNERIYTHLISRLIPNFHKHRALQPLSFDFLDIEGTRSSTNVNLTDPMNPHIHSIILIDEKLLPSFQALIDEQFESIVHYQSTSTHQRVFPTLKTMHAKQIDLSTLPDVVSYASKLLKNDRARAMMSDATLFAQLPKSSFERSVSDETRSAAAISTSIQTARHSNHTAQHFLEMKSQLAR